jgi:cytochrome c oxidase assembly factor 1
MRRVLSELRESEDVRTVLGDAVRLEPTWYLNGSPWVSGSVKMLQGNIDVSFRVKGHRGTHRFLLRTVDFFTYLLFVWYGKGAGTVYFTSIRRERGGPFTTCAYQISLALPPFSNPFECPHIPSTLLPGP